jgi:hypothetical protein
MSHVDDSVEVTGPQTLDVIIESFFRCGEAWRFGLMPDTTAVEND